MTVIHGGNALNIHLHLIKMHYGIYKRQGIGTALAEESYHGVHENNH